MGWVDVTVESSMYLSLLYKKALGNVLSKMMKVAIYGSYQLPILDARYDSAMKVPPFKHENLLLMLLEICLCLCTTYLCDILYRLFPTFRRLFPTFRRLFLLL